MSGLDALERLSTTDQVVRALRAAIVSGSIAQGEQLREIPLASQLGTGRSAVREALRQLVQEGLAQHEVHRGTFVRIITADDILDVYRAREAVECSALELVLARGDEVDISVLSAELDELREAAAGGFGTWQEMADVDIRLHERLVELSGSPRLRRMFETLAAESRMHLYAYPAYPALQNVADHERIVAALGERSPQAVELLREHLRFSARLAVEERG